MIGISLNQTLSVIPIERKQVSQKMFISKQSSLEGREFCWRQYILQYHFLPVWSLGQETAKTEMNQNQFRYVMM